MPFIGVDHGPQPGEVEVSWRIVSWSTFPIVEYQVAVSLAGPITEDNWDQALILARLSWGPGQVWFHEVYGADDGLDQGVSAWFAVRARDEAGNLSRLKTSPRWTLSTEWWIEGHLYDFAGATVPEMTVRSTWADISTLSDAEGLFRIGPFRNCDFIELETATTSAGPNRAWYGYTMKPVRARPGVDLVTGQDFLLIPRATVDPRCNLADDEFLTYLRRLTFTINREGDPNASILHRWKHYPLTVYIPAFVNDAGVPMDEAALIALIIWNNSMDEEYFMTTEDQASADIEFRFEEMNLNYGLVSLLQPVGQGTELGRVIPIKMAVTINPRLSTTKDIAEISLHELGHTLGFILHTNCQEAGYLMNLAGGFGALDKPEPIHLDERRAVRCIRHLPQGQDMNKFTVE